MAGWKLRKDKAQADAPETSEDPSEDPSENLSEDLPVPGWDTPAVETDETFLPATMEPTFETGALDTEFDTTEFDDAEPHHLGGVIALGGNAPEPLVISPLPDFETGEEVSFDDDEDEDAVSRALIFHDPKPAPASPTPDEARDVPEVAPFVMDTPPAAPDAALPHRLVMRIGKLSAAFDLVKDVTVIGRPDSDLHFYPDMEVEMDDAVSRRHAEVLKSGEGQYSLLDSGSTNGTRLNGELLPANEERLLAPGDRIHIGERTEIIFE